MDDICKHSFALDTDGYPRMRCDMSREKRSVSVSAVSRSVIHGVLRSQIIPQPTRWVPHVLQTTCTRPE